MKTKEILEHRSIYSKALHSYLVYAFLILWCTKEDILQMQSRISVQLCCNMNLWKGYMNCG